MRRRYTTQLVDRDRQSFDWIVVATKSFRTVERAKRWLPRITCTVYKYRRDLGRAG